MSPAPHNDSAQPSTPHNLDSLNREVESALADLQLAQARLDAARAKISGNEASSVLEDVEVVEENEVIVSEAVIVVEPVGVSDANTATSMEGSSDDTEVTVPDPRKNGDPSSSSPSSDNLTSTSAQIGDGPIPASSVDAVDAVPIPTNAPVSDPSSPGGDAAGTAPNWNTYTPDPSPKQYASPGAPPQYYAVPPVPPQHSYYQQQPQAHPLVTKDHVAAGLLGLFLGSLGIHKFYLGYNTSGFIMLAVTIIGTVLTFGLAGLVMWVIGIIEGIVYLTKSQREFDAIYVYNKREWF